MTLLICMIVSSLTALACAPALVSIAPPRRKPRASPSAPAHDSDLPSIESQVQQTRCAVRDRDTKHHRLVEVVEIIEETPDVVSVLLDSVDGSELPDFRPGQHVILERPTSFGRSSLSRCYTLSHGPTAKPWRITVRRTEASNESESMSHWIHRDLRVGDRLRVRGPRGSFTLDRADADKPIVLIAAGVGITPIASMLHEELRYPRARSKWLFYQVRQWDSAPLLPELVRLVDGSPACQATIAASREATPPALPSSNIQLTHGKLTPSAMIDSIGQTDVTILLCGPPSWMKAMRDGFIELGVPENQIHDEAFGAPELFAASETTSRDAVSVECETFEVAFEATGKAAKISANTPNLLIHAKNQGVTIPASCRAGHCGTCAVKLLRGTIQYLQEPKAELSDGEILPCICMPTSDIAIQA